MPFVLGGSLPLTRLPDGRQRPQWRNALSIGLIALVVAIPLRGLFRATGSSMEEAFMIVFPNRLVEGDVPNVDFLHLYGPFSLHILAGWYAVFGDTLQSERVFGLLQHLGVIFGIFTLARAWGRKTAIVSATTATLIVLTPIGLSALAWEGGIAFGIWSVVFGVRALHCAGRRRTVALVAAGVLAGFTIGYRPDLVLALALAHGWLLWRGRSEHTWRPAATGLAVGLVPMFVHLAMAGLGPSFQGMFLDPVFELRPGRELPSPPSFGQIDGALQAVAEGPADAPWWEIPAIDANHQLFFWFFMVLIVAVGLPLTAYLLWRRDGRGTGRLMVLVAAGFFGLGMIGQALQRPDSTHLAWGSCISFSLLPCLVHELFARRVPSRARQGWLAAAAVVGLAMLVVNPFFTYRYYLYQTRVALGQKPGGFEVSRDGRNFYFGNEALRASSQAAIDELDRLSAPGERLVVGPADLSRTIYSDVAFYYLFPELIPATYFIEMDPGLADEPGSRLADDVASADWLLLTNFWTGWYEPNASSEFGSTVPNRIVADQFCLVGNYENALVLLYRRCDQGDGVDPSTIGIGAQRRADFEAEKAEREAQN